MSTWVYIVLKVIAVWLLLSVVFGAVLIAAAGGIEDD